MQLVRSLPGSGHVEAWGYNFFGQLNVPAGLHDLIAVAAGGSHSLALRSNGTVVAWGDNSRGRATVPAGLSNVVAIAASEHSVALTSDGTVKVWGSNGSAVTNIPSSATGVVAIATGGDYTLAVRSDGTVVAWGYSSTVTNVPAGLTDVVALAGGNGHVLALKNDGTVIGWGYNHQGQATPPANLSGVVAVRAGNFSSFALKADGSMVQWGQSANLPSDLSGVADLHIGYAHGLALLTNGALAAWGYNAFGQANVPPGLSGVVAISAGGHHNLVITRRPIVDFISPPVTTNVGATVTFSISAGGSQLSYQWRHNDIPLQGRTNASLTLINVQPGDHGRYDVQVTNPYGTASAATSLAFPPPRITSQPSSQTKYRGEDARFDVAAEGVAPLTYQWFNEEFGLPGATNSTLIITNLRFANSGMYAVEITDVVNGTTRSQEATLTVNDPTVWRSATLAPVMDTSIFSSGGNRQGILTILSGTRNNGILDRGLLRFDTPELPPRAVIQTARVVFKVVRVPLTAVNSDFSLYRMLTPWDTNANWTQASTALLWNSPGGAAGIDYVNEASASFPVAGLGLYFASSPQLVADLERWRTNSAMNYGWLLKSEREDALRSARHFGASESTDSPQLFVEYSIPPLAPVLGNISAQDGSLTFGLDGEPGWIYRVEYCEDLKKASWVFLTNAPAGPGQRIVVTLPIDSVGQCFYRVDAE